MYTYGISVIRAENNVIRRQSGNENYVSQSLIMNLNHFVSKFTFHKLNIRINLTRQCPRSVNLFLF